MADSPARCAVFGDGAGSFHVQVGEFERRLLLEALARTHGNKAAAGRLLGLDENQVRYLCRGHGAG